MQAKNPTPKTPLQRLYLFAGGFFMGAADIIPGVSGGTIAFVLGFYEELITSIRSLRIDRPKEGCYQFLFCVFSGIAAALFLLSTLFSGWMNDPVSRTYLYATFFGLIVGSLYFVSKMLKRFSFPLFINGLFALVLSFLITSIPLKEEKAFRLHLETPLFDESLSNLDPKTGELLGVKERELALMLGLGIISKETLVSDGSEVFPAGSFIEPMENSLFAPRIVLSGVVASSAMLLPGISGSYMLVVIGVYPKILAALSQFTSSLRSFQFDIESFFLLANLMIGILVGLTFFSRVVATLLDRFHDLTIAALIGFMLGSLHTVWPFVEGGFFLNPLKLDHPPRFIPLQNTLPDLYSSVTWIALGFFTFGVFLVIFLEIVAIGIKNVD